MNMIEAEESKSMSVVTKIGMNDFSGNLVPHTWFEHIRRGRKANLHAILILSEIVYWYRPTAVKDENTGKLLGYRKKFWADMLQRSYISFAEQFGISKDQAKDAIDDLIRLGLIRREFRNLVSKTGIRMINVMYLEPVPSAIAAITGPKAAKELPPENPPDLLEEIYPGGVQNQGEEGMEKGGTNTEITSEISPNNAGNGSPDGLPPDAGAEAPAPETSVSGIEPMPFDEKPEEEPTQKKRGRPAGPISPLAAIHWEITKCRLTNFQKQQIEQIVPEDQAEKWKETVKAWALRGYKPNNIAGILRWFREGIPALNPYEQKIGSGGRKSTIGQAITKQSDMSEEYRKEMAELTERTLARVPSLSEKDWQKYLKRAEAGDEEAKLYLQVEVERHGAKTGRRYSGG